MTSRAARLEVPITSPTIDAKIVILGAQGVGKTSLISRFLHPAAATGAPLPSPQSTIGAHLETKQILDHDTGTLVRLQLWDTAGQERYRAISRMYYRDAHAGLLCYDVTDATSWEEMKTWLSELRSHCGDDLIVHVVGTKTDLVAEDPSRREVTYDQTVAYVSEHLHPGIGSAQTPPPRSRPPSTHLQSVDSKRSSGFWTQDFGWDSCHEVNAKDGEGIEEVFRVIARRLVEQRQKQDLQTQRHTPGGRSDGGDDYFTGPHTSQGSFRLGYGDKRRSWLGLPSVGLGGGGAGSGEDAVGYETDPAAARRRGRCC